MFLTSPLRCFGPLVPRLHWDRMDRVAIVCKPQKEELARILPELIAMASRTRIRTAP